MKRNVSQLLALIFLLLFYSCSSDKEIIVKQVPSNYPIILFKGRDVDRIVGVRIPLAFYLRKYTLREIKMSSSPHYLYDNLSSPDYFYGSGCTLYAHEKGELQQVIKVQKTWAS